MLWMTLPIQVLSIADLSAAPYSPNLAESMSVFNPASPSAVAVRNLFVLVLAIDAAIFVLVLGTLLYFAVRFRRKPDDDASEPPQIYGSARLETAWTLAPLVTVFVIFLVVVRTVVAMRSDFPGAAALDVRVVAHQWWWEFGYLQDGFVTANEMHVPVSGPHRARPVSLWLESADVAHSFWVPRLGGKTDVIPGRVNRMSFEADQPGIYRGQCSEFCGMQHAQMLIRVVAQREDEFRAWVAHQQQPAVEDRAAAPGRDLFMTNPCFNCHQIRGTPAHGRVGPDLTHLMSRQTLAATDIPNDREHLLAWITNPQAIKPGCKMPALNLSSHDFELVASYLLTLK